MLRHCCCFKPNQPERRGSHRQKPPGVEPPAPARPARPAPSTFDDLPNEIVCDIAADVFQAAVHDQHHDVSSLACSPRLQSALHDELHANAVLRVIHKARDFSELCRALTGVGGVFPRYRAGCLIAAIELLPKLGPGRRAPEALWLQLRALLPSPAPAPQQDAAASARFEAVVHALVQTCRPGAGNRSGFEAFMGLENVLALIGPDAVVSPPLATGLMRWVAQTIQCPGIDTAQNPLLYARLAVAAPVALQARLRRLFEFFERLHSAGVLPVAQTMARQMQEVEAAHAANEPDQHLQLRVLSRSWWLRTRRLPECAALYHAFFSRLDPARQMWLVAFGKSPLEPAKIVSFLHSQVGRVSGLMLLDTLAHSYVGALRGNQARRCAALVRSIVEAALETPQRNHVLARAITFDNVHHLGLNAFFTLCVARSQQNRRVALSLRLALAQVGCGEYEPRQVAGRAAASAMLDAVLENRLALDSQAIETIVELRIAWLDRHQRCRLIERIGQLPPAIGAHCLAAVISQFSSAALTSRLPPAALVLDACWSLPPEHRAAPVAALLDQLYSPDLQACTDLRQGAVQLYEALPAAWRPVFKRQRSEVLQQRNEPGLVAQQVVAQHRQGVKAPENA